MYHLFQFSYSVGDNMHQRNQCPDILFFLTIVAKNAKSPETNILWEPI